MKAAKSKLLQTLLKQFMVIEQTDEAVALTLVDSLMRHYAYTQDDLSFKEEELGFQLRALVGEWLERTSILKRNVPKRRKVVRAKN